MAHPHAPDPYFSALLMQQADPSESYSGPVGDKPARGRDSETEGRQGLPEREAVEGDAPPGGSRETAGGEWSRRNEKSPLTGICLSGGTRRTAATYSPSWWASTIGADELNGSVRDGKRWILIALTTAISYLRDHTLSIASRLFFLEERVRAISTGRLCHRWLYTSRLSTSWSTTTL